MLPCVPALANVEGVHLTPQTQTLFEVIRLPQRSHRSYFAVFASPPILGTRRDARTSLPTFPFQGDVHTSPQPPTSIPKTARASLAGVVLWDLWEIKFRTFRKVPAGPSRGWFTGTRVKPTRFARAYRAWSSRSGGRPAALTELAPVQRVPALSTVGAAGRHSQLCRNRDHRAGRGGPWRPRRARLLPSVARHLQDDVVPERRPHGSCTYSLP